jgi:radical SAM superfamily enzyme YgiQ (UPF0313 family)
MKVVIANAPRGKKGAAERSKLPPLGIAYLASALENAGHKVALLDAHNYDLSSEEVSERIAAEKPDVFGISCLTHNRFAAIEVIEQVKAKTGALVIAGGNHFTLTGRDALENIPSLDLVAKGEAEQTLVEVVEAHARGKKFDDIIGLYFRGRTGEIVETPDRPFEDDLDRIAGPAWHLYNLKDYDRPIDGTNIRSLGVISTRGCPNKCAFCGEVAFSKAIMRRHSPAHFVDQLAMLKSAYGISGYSFWDDTFTVVKSHVRGVCDLIESRGLDIRWYARARVNTVDRATLERMKSAGCITVSYGVESGSQRILERIRKNITIEQVRRAVADSLDVGLHVKLFFIMSHLDERREDVRTTLRFMRELEAMSPDVECKFGIVVIFPGTEVERVARERGYLPADFSWHRYREFPKWVISGYEPWMPYFEQPELPLEEIRALICRERFTRMQLIGKGARRLWNLRTGANVAATARIAGRYIRGFFR